MEIWLLVLSIFVVGIIGTGLGFWLWHISRPKTMKWKAMVYQLGEGVMRPERDAEGNIISRIPLSALRPYYMDVLEKLERKSGATHYLLKGLKKATPQVTAKCVENWGKHGKMVRVLLEEDSATLLTGGYDKKTGEEIFRPMAHDRSTMIKTEIYEKKQRIQERKDIFAALTPWIVTGLWALSLVVMTYLLANAMVKISDNMVDVTEKIGIKQVQIAEALGGDIRNPNDPTDDRIAVEEEPPEIPP